MAYCKIVFRKLKSMVDNFLVTSVRWCLVEARRKRANFLRVVVREVGLENVEVFEGRVEEMRAGRAMPCRTVVSRGVWGVERFLCEAGGLLESGGLAVAFAGAEARKVENEGPFRLVEELEVRTSGKRLLVYRREGER